MLFQKNKDITRTLTATHVVANPNSESSPLLNVDLPSNITVPSPRGGSSSPRTQVRSLNEYIAFIFAY